MMIKRNPGTSIVRLTQDPATGVSAWAPKPTTLAPIPKFRITATATPAELSTQFNRAQDEIAKSTAGARDLTSSTRTIYAAYAFTNGHKVQIPHLLGTGAGVTMNHSSPYATPGVTAGSPWLLWELNATNPELVDVTPAGTFTCDVEFRPLG